MSRCVFAFFVLVVSSVWIPAPAFAQSPTEFPCTKEEADSGLPTDPSIDQETGCNQVRFRRYSSYDAGLDQYYCAWSEYTTTSCPNTNSITTPPPSPSPSATSSGTPSASLRGQYGLGGVNEQTLCLATDRLGGTKGSCDAFKSAAFLGAGIAGTQVSAQGAGGIAEALGQFTKAQVPAQFLPQSLTQGQAEKNIIQKAVDAIKGFFFDFLLGQVFQARE